MPMEARLFHRGKAHTCYDFNRIDTYIHKFLKITCLSFHFFKNLIIISYENFCVVLPIRIYEDGYKLSRPKN